VNADTVNTEAPRANVGVRSCTPTEVAALRARARRAYELGMLRLGLVRAAVVTCLVAVLAAAGVARLPSPAWLVPVFAAWLLVGWRGALVWRGALAGLVAGLAALALPISLLRPCCATMTGATGCSMPEVCMAAGALLGLVVVASLPRLGSPSEWARACGGALLAVASLVASRCATLFLGETLGLLGGMLASAAGVAAARAWWSRRSASPS
jgi:hypothetical protein